jgi:hypothetical protein
VGQKLALHRLIWDSRRRVPCTYPILDPTILSKFERRKEEVPKVSPNFQNRLQMYEELTTLNMIFSVIWDVMSLW